MATDRLALVCKVCRKGMALANFNPQGWYLNKSGCAWLEEFIDQHDMCWVDVGQENLGNGWAANWALCTEADKDWDYA